MELTKILETTTNTVTLKSAEDLRQNPLAATWVVVTGDLEGLNLDELITKHTGLIARVKETTWDAVSEGIEDEAIAKVRWCCESCLVIGEVVDAKTERNGEFVCQDCADDIDDRVMHAR